MKNINWATKENAERPNNFSSPDYILLNVNVIDVFSYMDDDFKLDLFDNTGGENAIGNRLDRAKEYFLSGEPMDYPEVAYSKYNKTIDFTNGRHRSVASFQLGNEYVPMFIYKDTLDEFIQLVRTKPMEQQNPINFLKENYPINKQKKVISHKNSK